MEVAPFMETPLSFLEACKVSLSNGVYCSQFTQERTRFLPDSFASPSGKTVKLVNMSSLVMTGRVISSYLIPKSPQPDFSSKADFEIHPISPRILHLFPCPICPKLPNICKISAAFAAGIALPASDSTYNGCQLLELADRHVLSPFPKSSESHH